MITKCPTCGTKYKIDPAKLSSKNAKIRCKKCGTVFSVYENAIDNQPVASKNTSDAKKQSTVSSGDFSVFVCTARDEIYKAVADKIGGSKVSKIDDGVEALYKIIKDKPSLVFVDVDLPRIYGFEITELVRRNDPDKKIYMVLLGSIYNKNAYKRSPSYAYGADKYIDHSDVAEHLDSILAEITGSPKTEKKQPEKEPIKEPKKESASQKVQEQPAPASESQQPKKETKEIDLDSLSPEDKTWVKKAERKARIIAADIALYNEDGIKEGLKNGDVYERIAADLDAGTKHFTDNIPEHIRNMKDFIGEEVEKMLDKKRKEFGL